MSPDAVLATALTAAAAGVSQEAAPLARARALAADADRALEGGTPERAITLYDQAIGVLGDSYRRKGVMDDTSMQLILARSEAKKGAHERAARLMRTAVTSRLIQASR